MTDYKVAARMAAIRADYIRNENPDTSKVFSTSRKEEDTFHATAADDDDMLEFNEKHAGATYVELDYLRDSVPHMLKTGFGMLSWGDDRVLNCHFSKDYSLGNCQVKKDYFLPYRRDRFTPICSSTLQKLFIYIKIDILTEFHNLDQYYTMR